MVCWISQEFRFDVSFKKDLGLERFGFVSALFVTVTQITAVTSTRCHLKQSHRETKQITCPDSQNISYSGDSLKTRQYGWIVKFLQQDVLVHSHLVYWKCFFLLQQTKENFFTATIYRKFFVGVVWSNSNLLQSDGFLSLSVLNFHFLRQFQQCLSQKNIEKLSWEAPWKPSQILIIIFQSLTQCLTLTNINLMCMLSALLVTLFN